MSIERNEGIRFHEKGTLDAVTRWIASHHDGIAEWFKNVRPQYQVDRANVAAEHRVAVLLLKDARDGHAARIGVLDVAGATLEDVTMWSTWQDPEASRRGVSLDEEETQGNGGKSYMYRLFTGPTRIFGVRDGHRNCKGFEGDPGTVARGTPGWVPSLIAGREVEISSLDAESRDALRPYDIRADDLPERVQKAIKSRKAFTLVEGEDPTGLYKGRIDAEGLISNVVRHEQSTLCLEQVDFFVMHNGRLLNDGKRLQLPPISPYPGLDSPVVHAIPDQLPLDNGEMVSTTEGGTRDRGRLTLHTSAENMQAAWRNLRPRWQIIYRTRYQMIGSKPVSEIAGTTPGAQYVYGTVELPALEPAYVEHGRRRPKPGPLTEALDRFIAEKIKEVAHQINARRQEKLDDRALDEVHEENRKLDELKNRFLPNAEDEGNGGAGTKGSGGGIRVGGGGGPTKWGTIPEELGYAVVDGGIDIGEGVSVVLRAMLEVSVRDAKGLPVRAALEWFTSDRQIVSVLPDSTLTAKEKGVCEIWIRVKGTSIESERIPVRVWNVDHVLLTPRTIDIPVGKRQQVVAEITDDEGRRSTEVLLDWRHDADDQLIVRISRQGVITGNRVGRTAVSAGAGGVWARIPIEVNVIPNPENQKRGSGYPKLLLTDRDLDPATGLKREGDPDQPPLWQEPSDFVHNVWWLNLQSPEAAFAFRARSTAPVAWRTYHAERLIDMVVQVWMTEEFTRKGESQRPEFWAAHLAAMDRHRVRLVHQMWKRLEPYVSEARLLLTDGDNEIST
jgi:hypothetical protein